ncbi:MAG: type IV secretion system DNA-binding domain-containing protein [Nanoarchaeota archaeon]|nr:type IV secretion system DNA-binding domain-containing protein [Nanoarchaeota archaeon]
MRNKKRYLLELINVYQHNIVLPLKQTVKKTGAPRIALLPHEDLGAGILILGNTGSGKTNVIDSIIYQLPISENDPVIIFDVKTDYIKEFRKEKDIVIGLENSTHSWNIFDEAGKESDFHELAREIYPLTGSEKDYWPKTAGLLFEAILIAVQREAENMGKKATNHVLVKFILEHTMEETYNLLNSYKDLRRVAQYINPDSHGASAMDTMKTFNADFSEIFRDDFADSSRPVFSIREYMKNPRGRALFLACDMVRIKTVAPMFRLLIDTASKYALRPEFQDRHKYFVVDEAQLLPHLSGYAALVNAGRSFLAACFTGIQSISQLNAAYGKDMANSILSGHWYAIMLRQNDEPSKKFVRDMIGDYQLKQTTPIVEPGAFGTSEITGYMEHIQDVPSLIDQEILFWPPGVGVYKMPTKWMRINFMPYEDIKKHIDWVEDEIKEIMSHPKMRKYIGKIRKKTENFTNS